MTMPHLMNCDHICNGWCLECVNEMHKELDTAKDEVRELKKIIGRYEVEFEKLPHRTKRYLTLGL